MTSPKPKPSSPRSLLGYFDQGQVPTVSIVNAATTPVPDLAKIMDALAQLVTGYFTPIWGVGCRLRLVGKAAIPATDWAVVLMDDADAAGALGYHDLTPAGLPLSKVFVRTVAAAGESLSVTMSHELLEMLIDPGVQMLALGPPKKRGTALPDLYAYEVCDAVQEQDFNIGGVRVSNFVYPAYFESFRKPGSTRFDYLGRLSRPFEIAPGGYMPIIRDGRWMQVFGSAKAERGYQAARHPRTECRVAGRRLEA